MKHRIHGVISLVLAVCAFVIGLASVLAESLVTGAFYAARMLCGPVLIIASFCTKCPCREEGCGHILPGMLARYLPRREGPYSLWDLLGMGAPLAGLILFPQPWLWRRKPLSGPRSGRCSLSPWPKSAYACVRPAGTRTVLGIRSRRPYPPTSSPPKRAVQS